MMSSLACNPWIPSYQPKPQKKLRLFCFPYAGGGASMFRAWSNLFPPEIDICAVQYPGRESRLLESPFTQLSQLIEALVPALLPYLTTPFAFFGHSMGALVGFELARRLRRQYGFSPVHLFISGRRAPQIPDLDPPIHHLPEPAFTEEVRRLQGTPEEVLQNVELWQLLRPVLQADFTICETYLFTPDEPLSCPLSAFGGLQDTEVPRDVLDAWREQTTGPFKLRFFAGDHFYLHTTRSLLVQVLAQALFQHLNQRQQLHYADGGHNI